MSDNISTNKEAAEELKEISWEYRIFSTKKPKEKSKYGLKKVFLKNGKVIDFDERFIVRPVFNSPKELKDGLDTMLRDLKGSREGSMVLQQKTLNKIIKEKGEVDVTQDLYYG